MEDGPCSRAASISPSKPTEQSSRQCLVELQQPHPGRGISIQSLRLHYISLHIAANVNKTYDSQILKWPGGLDILESLFEILQFHLHLDPCFFSILDSLGFKRFNGFQLPV